MRDRSSALRLGLVVGLFVAAVHAVGCGYALVSGKPARAGTVAIVTPENRTAEPGIELVVAEALRREFLRRGQLELISDPARADFVVRGSVSRIETTTRSFSEVVASLEFSVTLVVDLRLEAADGVEVALDPRALSETEVYQASADVEVGHTKRSEALRRLASLVAGRVHDAVSIARAPVPDAGSE